MKRTNNSMTVNWIYGLVIMEQLSVFCLFFHSWYQLAARLGCSNLIKAACCAKSLHTHPRILFTPPRSIFWLLARKIVFKFIIQTTLISNYYFFSCSHFVTAKQKTAGTAIYRWSLGGKKKQRSDLWASSVRMKVSRKCFLVSSWPKSVRAFSTLAWTWWGRRRRQRKPRLQSASGHLLPLVFSNRASPFILKPCQVFSNSRSLRGKGIDSWFIFDDLFWRNICVFTLLKKSLSFQMSLIKRRDFCCDFSLYDSGKKSKEAVR